MSHGVLVAVRMLRSTRTYRTCYKGGGQMNEGERGEDKHGEPTKSSSSSAFPSVPVSMSRFYAYTLSPYLCPSQVRIGYLWVDGIHMG
jgi:hypothetical protein